MNHQIDWELSESKIFKSGCVRVAYRSIRKINSRTAFGVGFLPICLLTFEISFQYI